jgi:hypothetical protein
MCAFFCHGQEYIPSYLSGLFLTFHFRLTLFLAFFCLGQKFHSSVLDKSSILLSWTKVAVLEGLRGADGLVKVENRASDWCLQPLAVLVDLVKCCPAAP